MKRRCNNASQPCFRHYGGRGIRVCERWQRFENFLADVGERPDGMSIDRIDVDGDYEPGNCKWATRAEQSRNKRGTKLYTYNGKTMCMADWIKEIRGGC